MGYYQDRPRTKLERIRDALEDIEANGLGMATAGTSSGGSTTLDKTWQELYDLFSSGIGVVVSVDTGAEVPDVASVVSIYISGNDYCLKDANGNVFVTNSADGNPVFSGT